MNSLQDAVTSLRVNLFTTLTSSQLPPPASISNPSLLQFTHVQRSPLLSEPTNGLAPDQLTLHDMLRQHMLWNMIIENRVQNQINMLMMLQRGIPNSGVAGCQAIPATQSQTAVTTLQSQQCKSLWQAMAMQLCQNYMSATADVQCGVVHDSNPSSYRRKNIHVTNIECAIFRIQCRNQRKDKRWMVRYEELLKFQQKHGHCRVPHGFSDNRKLSW